MFYKVILLCFVSTISAIIIKSNGKYTTSDWHGSKQAKYWRVIPVYHHPNIFGPMYKEEPHTFPKYEFKYMVSDKKTGDHKQHQESRDGDRVVGEYSLMEPNGFIRKVQYHADDHHGFNAVVSKSFIKHGEDAYSAYMHTSYVSPSSGYQININHPLPTKYFSNHNQKYEESGNDFKHEMDVKRDKGAEHEDKTSVEFEAQKVVLVKQPITAIEDLKDEDKQVVSVEVKEMAPSKENTKENDPVMNILPVIATINEPRDKTNNGTSKQIDDESTTQKVDAQPDSAISSSYYRSRIYYLI